MELKRISGLLVACLLVASLAAACSSSSKKAASVSAGGNANASTSTTKASTSNNSASSSNSSNSGSSGDVSKCLEASSKYQKALADEQSAMAPGKAFDASAIEKSYDAVGSLVPSKLKSDYNTLGTAIKQWASAMQGIDLSNPSSYANPATAAKIQSASAALQTPQVTSAEKALSDYFSTECK